MRATFKKINDIFSWVLLICAFVLLLFSFAARYQFAKTGQMAFLFGYRPFHVLSGSMEPYLKTNGLFIAKEVNSIDEIAVKDVIIFHSPYLEADKSITHRIVSIEDGIIQTKGDNNALADNIPLTIEDVEAKVVLPLNCFACVFNGLEKLTSLWQTTSGKLSIACLGIVLLLAYFGFKFLAKLILDRMDTGKRNIETSYSATDSGRDENLTALNTSPVSECSMDPEDFIVSSHNKFE